MKAIFTITLLLALPHFIWSQKSAIETGIGFSSGLNKSAGGYAVSLGFVHQLKGRHSLGLELEHAYNTSNKGLSGIGPNDTLINIRRFTNRPAIRPPVKAERFFNFNMGLQYRYRLFENTKSSFSAGLGMYFSYRDEMEVAQLLKFLTLGTGHPTYEKISVIPIYRYNTYWDVGFAPQLSYRYHLSEKMYVQTLHKLYLFPFSDNVVYTGTVGLGFRL
jgi:hypothetical protein